MKQTPEPSVYRLTAHELGLLLSIFRSGHARLYDHVPEAAVCLRLVNRGLLSRRPTGQAWMEFRMAESGRTRVREALGLSAGGKLRSTRER